MQEAVIDKIFDRGFGFIKVNNSEKLLYFHVSSLEKGVIFDELKVGDTVCFRGVDITNKGEMAVGITRKL